MVGGTLRAPLPDLRHAGGCLFWTCKRMSMSHGMGSLDLKASRGYRTFNSS